MHLRIQRTGSSQLKNELFERRAPMPRKYRFGYIGGSPSAENRHVRKQMIRGWDAVSKVVTQVDAQFIRDLRGKLRCSRALLPGAYA